LILATTHTNRRHLAPISGSIDPTDPSPLAAAWREISEETTLTPSSLTLLRHGKSYVFSDPSVGREWTIFPFAFQLKTPADEENIHIDWEHSDWSWHDPLSVVDDDKFGGVPRLAESLRRVWFEMDLGAPAASVLSDRLHSLATDYQSGARQMAGVALATLRDIIAAHEPCEPSEKWWANVRFAAWHLWKNGRESMGAAIMSALLGALSDIETALSRNTTDNTTKPWRGTVLALLDSHVAARSRSNTAISTAFSDYITKTFSLLSNPDMGSSTETTPRRPPLSVLTLSESSTITQALQHLTTNNLPESPPLDIRILESRPLYEGVSLASSLLPSMSASRGDTLTIYTDAAAALASSTPSHPSNSRSHNGNSNNQYEPSSSKKGVDILLLGADRIASNGATSNKTGTLPAVLSARFVTSRPSPSASNVGINTENSPDIQQQQQQQQHHTIKVLVLGDTEKIAPPGRPEEHVVEDNDADQVISGWKSAGTSQRIKAASEVIERHININGADNVHVPSGRDTTRGESRKSENVEKEKDREKGENPVRVIVRNVSFEWCPPELIDAYITEQGEQTVHDIARRSQELADKEHRIFGNL